MNKCTSKVYVLTDEDGRITRCEGGYTMQNIQNIEEWVLIDEGNGDKYNLCQSHYFDGGLYTMDGVFRYKLADGKPELRTAEEMEGDRVPAEEPGPTLDDRVTTLEADSAETREALDMILSGVTSDE